MLDKDRLRDKLREFHDTQYASFRGFPPTKAAARADWAAAFDDYISVAEEDIPRPPPPPNTHPSLTMTAVRSAFEGDLDLTDTISAATAAADFAGAWKTAIEAITPGPPATDSSSATYLFVKFINIDPLHATLKATLEALFSAPSSQSVQRLSDIAAAFHAASDGLQYTATKTVGTTSSPTTVGLK